MVMPPRPALGRRSEWTGMCGEGAPGPRTPELQFSPPKGPLLTPPTLLPSPAAISIFCIPLCHRTENSSYGNPAGCQNPEYQISIQTQIPHSPNLGVPSLTLSPCSHSCQGHSSLDKYLNPGSAHPSQHLLCRGHHPNEMWGAADPCPPVLSR